MKSICDDLVAEHAALEEIVSELEDSAFDRLTPAAGWSVRDQISHVWFFDQRALLALTDPEAFAVDAAVLLSAGGTQASVVPGRSMSAGDLVASWRRDRAALVDAARSIDPTSRVPWYGPAMAARSFITARLMETGAHGQDVADTFGNTRAPTARLRHVAHIGVRARPFSYMLRGKDVPADDVSVVLAAPDGNTWEWGTSDSQRITGPALDFCLVVTQRRHVADTALAIEGEVAREWIGIAQAFAGGIGSGRRPGQHTAT
jgi:uncharacterized protein (TIGR03084 family)